MLEELRDLKSTMESIANSVKLLIKTSNRERKWKKGKEEMISRVLLGHQETFQKKERDKTQEGLQMSMNKEGNKRKKNSKTWDDGDYEADGNLVEDNNDSIEAMCEL
jgi:hypothetical protein